MTGKEKGSTFRFENDTIEWSWNPERGVYENSTFPRLIIVLALPDQPVAGELCRWVFFCGLRDGVLVRLLDEA